MCLRNVVGLQVAGNLCAVGWAEAVWERAVGVVADGRRVGVTVGVTPPLVAAVGAVHLAVAEQVGVQAGSKIENKSIQCVY